MTPSRRGEDRLFRLGDAARTGRRFQTRDRALLFTVFTKRMRPLSCRCTQLGFFQSRKAAKIRFVFPKRRSFRRREHCPGGGGGRRGHYLDKRSGAIHCQRQTRSQHGIASVLLANGFLRACASLVSPLTMYTKKGATAPCAFTGTCPSSRCTAGSSRGFRASFSE
jgi:hypothetical protein